MARWRRDSRSGFTLVEVLVALAVIAVALMAALRAAGQGTAGVDELRHRLLATWVAEDILAEQRALEHWPSPGTLRGSRRQGGLDFAWREEILLTQNPAFRRVDVTVFAAPDETHSLARLSGFVVRPPVPAK
jgi:general secretion pathway protein I